MIAYKQRQQEKRYELAIQEIQKHQEEIDKVLETYEDDLLPRMKELIEIYFDYCIQSTQDEKIKLLANGYVSSIKTENTKNDVFMCFYDTLLQVNILDIRVLKLHNHIGIDKEDSIIQICKDYNIDFSQYNMIRMKLVRLGLLENRNDIKQDKNIDAIIDFIQASMKNKENDAKRAINKIKKISKQDGYEITSYGRNFIKFFGEE